MTHSGGKPHTVGDRGQRYEVKFKKGTGVLEETFGYSESYTGAQGLASSVERHPTWHSPKIVDRIPGGRK